MIIFYHLFSTWHSSFHSYWNKFILMVPPQQTCEFVLIRNKYCRFVSEAIFDFSYRGAGRGLWNGLGFWVHFAVPANCNTVIWRQKKKHRDSHGSSVIPTHGRAPHHSTPQLRLQHQWRRGRRQPRSRQRRPLSSGNLSLRFDPQTIISGSFRIQSCPNARSNAFPHSCYRRSASLRPHGLRVPRRVPPQRW